MSNKSNLKIILKTIFTIIIVYLFLNFVVGQRHYNNVVNLFPEKIQNSISNIFFPIKYIKSLKSEINYLKSAVG